MRLRSTELTLLLIENEIITTTPNDDN